MDSGPELEAERRRRAFWRPLLTEPPDYELAAIERAGRAAALRVSPLSSPLLNCSHRGGDAVAMARFMRAPLLFREGRSPLWPAKRRAHLKLQPSCAACGGRVYLQVHHKVPFHIDPKLELEPDNLITLCEAPSRLCHYRCGHSFDWAAFNPDVEADAALQLLRIQERDYK